MLQFFDEYAKHFALNIGTALHGARYLLSHPDVDARAPRGDLKHAWLSAQLRSKRLLNDLFFAVIPPHWHHSRAELAAMAPISMWRWFHYGYGAWRFTETGEPKPDLAGVDRRWDPRCAASEYGERDPVPRAD
jgi:hypothetical protein